jgi:hypothetical protein
VHVRATRQIAWSFVPVKSLGVHAMVFVLLSAVGITALLFLGFYQFCHLIVEWLESEAP